MHIINLELILLKVTQIIFWEEIKPAPIDVLRDYNHDYAAERAPCSVW